MDSVFNQLMNEITMITNEISSEQFAEQISAVSKDSTNKKQFSSNAITDCLIDSLVIDENSLIEHIADNNFSVMRYIKLERVKFNLVLGFSV